MLSCSPEYQEIMLYDPGVEDDVCVGDINIVTNLNILGAVWKYDGALETFPIFFFQLYAIHAEVGSSNPPCLYFLLPNKTQATYERTTDILLFVMTGPRPEKSSQILKLRLSTQLQKSSPLPPLPFIVLISVSS